MPDSSQTKIQIGVQFPKLLLQGEELYNFLMRQIEPELTTDVLHTLSEKYAHETEAEATARAERYNKAFESYKAALDTYRVRWTQELHQYHRIAMVSLEQKTKDKEKEGLSVLETTIENSLSPQL